jgi:large subunit ribosomal protein L24
MANKIHVKEKDTVIVLTGKDAGKSGKVLQVDKADGRILVEGVNMATKHKKPRGRYQQGGIIHQEAPIHGSNVMLVCAECKHPTKPINEIRAGGEKVRKCRKCGAVIETVREASK